MKKITSILLISLFVLSGCSMFSSKPSKSEVVDGMMKKVTSSEEYKDASDDDIKEIKKAFTCVIDKTYDDLSDKALEAFTDDSVKGEDVDGKLSKKDQEVLDKSYEKCADS